MVGRGTSAGRLSLLKLDFGEQVGREGGRIPFLASGLAKKKEGRAEYVLAPSGPYIPHSIHARLFLKAEEGEGRGRRWRKLMVISPPPPFSPSVGNETCYHQTPGEQRGRGDASCVPNCLKEDSLCRARQ